jgi:hypothetical protein
MSATAYQALRIHLHEDFPEQPPHRRKPGPQRLEERWPDRPLVDDVRSGALEVGGRNYLVLFEEQLLGLAGDVNRVGLDGSRAEVRDFLRRLGR